MRQATVTLSERQIFLLCDAMNREAQRFGAMALNARLDPKSKTPKQTITVWENASQDRFAFTHELLRAAGKGCRTAVIIEARLERV